jgi:hypothetical protein
VAGGVPQADIRVSPIAGRGLFATDAVAVGTVVLRQDGIGALNHSCDPNLGWTPEGAIAAMRDIGADEELTLDYATVIDDPDFAMVCHCETYRCRQMIEGSDWQIPQLQQRYAGRWHPSVQRRIDQT